MSLQVLALLPPHLEDLVVSKCNSLQNPPDLSLLKKLRYLRIVECNSVKSVCFEERLLQASITADIPNKEIPGWFKYRCNGCTLSFNFPPILEDSHFHLTLWVVYKIINIDDPQRCIRAVISNETQGITKNYHMDLPPDQGGILQSKVGWLSRNFISLEGGDRITILFQSSIYHFWEEVGSGEVTVEMCGVHVRQTPSSTS
nr:PREDICTED: uncharacterized protein LOC108216830 isoform X1 [Daucus carota subsp. sativus]